MRFAISSAAVLAICGLAMAGPVPQYQHNKQSHGQEQDKYAAQDQIQHKGLSQTQHRGLSQAQPKGLSQTQPKGLSQTQLKGLSQTQPKGLSQTQTKSLSQTQPKNLIQTQPKDLSQNQPKALSETQPTGLSQGHGKASSYAVVTKHESKYADPHAHHDHNEYHEHHMHQEQTDKQQDHGDQNASGHDNSHVKYEFQYGVQDPKTGDFKEQWEARDGDTVKGSYALKEADGTTRVVEYSSDKNSGFEAIVHRIGYAHHDLKDQKEEDHQEKPEQKAVKQEQNAKYETHEKNQDHPVKQGNPEESDQSQGHASSFIVVRQH